MGLFDFVLTFYSKRLFQCLVSCHSYVRPIISVENTTEEESGKKLEVEELRANLDEARYNVSNIQERHSA
jgi:hypothetical protein